ncbi:MAG: transporter substrate-binding domain-containing protein [Clostridia bacterium]|nr:transporter substrate-binding domain-containing protein [Clostridia bacterium]
MKKILTIALCLMLALSLAACGGNTVVEEATDATEATATYKTVTDGVLTVATSPDYAPYEFYAIDENGNANLAGFDIELAKYIANELGLEVEFVPMDFDGVLMEVGLGTVDMGVAGLSPDPEREKTMDFSVTYYEGGQAFITTKANADKFTDLASANQAGLQIGAQIGTIQEDLAKQFSADADLVSLPKATDIIAELIGGKLDGAYIEWDVAESYQKNYPDLVLVCEVPYEAEGNVIGVPKGNEELLAAINAALTKCVEEGTFADFVAQAQTLAEGEIVEGLLE